MTPEIFATEQYNLIVDNLPPAAYSAMETINGQIVMQEIRRAVEAAFVAQGVVLLELLSRYPACPNAAPGASSGCVLPDLASRCPRCLLRSLGVYDKA